jgi:subtilase family serine protease
VAQSDIDTATAWLNQKGFQVNQVNAARTMIDFSGTADSVKQAFGTEIHRLDVNGAAHIANMSDPKIPAALAPLVAGIVSLHDFRPHTNYKRRPDYTYTSGGSTLQALVPADLATIYNLNPLFNAGIKGQGQTIVLIEDTNVHSTADVATFRSTFGLPTANFTQVHPGNCTNPGDVAGNDGEASLDVEWAGAVAPAAALELASCADTATTFGGLIAMQNLINASSPPAIMSVSYGECEAENGATANAAYISTYQQAASEGVSVFVSAGDEGAASCDADANQATHGIAVSGFASTPYNVAVGGTDFSDTYSGTTGNYWNTTNTSTYGSAKSYIPEIPWNDSCASKLIASYSGSSATYGSGGFCNNSTGEEYYLTTASGSGGPSGCASGTASTSGVVSGNCAGNAKPSWQAGFLGNPNDGVRDIPDVSLFAANGVWGHYYVYCYTGSSSDGGAACTGAPSGWSGAGGTSFSAPIMAAIQSLVNQKTGSSSGNPNPVYYQLAAAEYGSSGSSSCNSSNGSAVGSTCIFYDVTQGDMDVNCAGSNNCYRPSGSNGVLSTSNSSYVPAFGTGTGWDFATGIGSVNAANLVNGWPGAGASANYSLSSSPGSVSENQGASVTTTVTVTPQNGFTGSVALSASGLPSGVTASFSPASTTGTSTLTLAASSAAATGTSTITITGTSGSLTQTASVSLTVNAVSQANYTLAASPGSLTEKQGGSATSTIAVTALNGFSGSVALSASGLPTGVTASFSPASTTSSSTLTLTASSTAATGTSTITITGISGSLTHTTSVSLTVTSSKSANYTLAASPGSLTVSLGAKGSSTIKLTPQNGFTGSVALSASGLPKGVTASFSPASTTSSSTLTLTASSTAATGTSTITITGVSGSLSHTTSLSLTVRRSQSPYGP